MKSPEGFGMFVILPFVGALFVIFFLLGVDAEMREREDKMAELMRMRGDYVMATPEDILRGEDDNTK